MHLPDDTWLSEISLSLDLQNYTFLNGYNYWPIQVKVYFTFSPSFDWYSIELKFLKKQNQQVFRRGYKPRTINFPYQKSHMIKQQPLSQIFRL